MIICSVSQIKNGQFLTTEIVFSLPTSKRTIFGTVQAFSVDTSKRTNLVRNNRNILNFCTILDRPFLRRYSVRTVFGSELR